MAAIAIISLLSTAFGKQGDPNVKACRIHAREQRSSDRIDPGPQGTQAAPLFLDGVMYVQPRLRGRDISGNAEDKTSSYRNGQGTSELGIIDTCRNRPRYY